MTSSTLPRISLIFSSCAFLQFIPTASHPSLGDNHQSTGGRFERTHCQAKMAAWNSFSYICTRALHSFAQPPSSFLCCPRPPSHHPSSPTRLPPFISIFTFVHIRQHICAGSRVRRCDSQFHVSSLIRYVRNWSKNCSFSDTLKKSFNHFPLSWIKFLYKSKSVTRRTFLLQFLPT